MTNVTKKRPIKSYVRREGRITLRQTEALTTLWPRFGLTVTTESVDLAEIFSRPAATVLEIGFGMGHSLLQMAVQAPELNFIGIEVHRPGVGRLLGALEDASLDNVKLFKEDANLVLKQSIKDETLSKIQIFFPDPWPKQKHHKRRLIQPDFVAMLATKLQPGGILHLATDWQDYAAYMMAVLSAAPDFKNTVSEGGYLENQTVRPSTKFELRGQRLGHDIWDLVFVKASS